MVIKGCANRWARQRKHGRWREKRRRKRKRKSGTIRERSPRVENFVSNEEALVNSFLRSMGKTIIPFLLLSFPANSSSVSDLWHRRDRYTTHTRAQSFFFFFFFGWLVRPRAAVSLSPAGRKEEGSLRPTGVLPRGIVRGRLIAVRSHPTPPSHPDFAICGDVYALPGKKLWTSLSSVWNDIDPSHERKREREREQGESDIIFARKEKFVEESYFVVR